MYSAILISIRLVILIDLLGMINTKKHNFKYYLLDSQLIFRTLSYRNYNCASSSKHRI